ncbi:MAG: putative heme transporter [Solirubrobacterales bacterium]|jgi:uncharacterized membrane protein YbhN (UPF0104 family)|nr:putative heme transporter [Solirubrobacterales bacterium]
MPDDVDMNQIAMDRVMANEMELEGSSLGQGGRRLAEIGVFAALIGGALFALPGLGDLRARLAGADPKLIALAAAFEVGSCLAFVAAFRGVFSRRLSWRFSYEVGMAEQAANVLLPTGGAGGLALGAWALRRIGMPADRIGRRTVAFFLITSSVNFAAVIFAGLALGLGLLPGEVAFAAAVVPALLAAAFLTAIALSPRLLEGAADGEGGRIRAALASGRGYAADGIRDAISLLGSGRPLIVGGAIGYMALDVMALAAVFAAFGGGAPPLGVFVLAYAVGQLGGLVPLPGGIGGTDGGLILTFGLLGTPVAIAAAAVIGYRAFQLGVPAILGITAYGSLRRKLAGAPEAEPAAARRERSCVAPQLEPA